MNHILAVCDAEEAYASKLVDYINLKEGFPFQARYFFSLEKLEEFCNKQRVEVLLLSEKLYQEKVSKMNTDKIIILQEEDAFWEDSYGMVWKYQSCETMLKEILSLLAKEPGKLNHIIRKSGLKVTGFYSPVKRSLQTSFALAMGQLLAKKGKTLYVNMEACSGLDRLLGREFAKDLSDLLYYLQNGQNGISYYLSSITEQVGGLEILPPMRSQTDLISISTREWLQLFYEIEVCTEYEYLLLDLSDSVQGLFEILQHCDRIFTVTAEDGVAMAKMDQYEKMLKQCQYEEIMNKTRKCSFPRISYLPKQLERLSMSELASIAKEYLKEDFYAKR